MQTFIIYGISAAGLRIAEYLIETGSHVRVIAPHDHEFSAKLIRAGAELVSADIDDFEVLRKHIGNGISGLLLPSENELFNINAALHAAEYAPSIPVAARLFNLALGRKLEATIPGLTVLSVSRIASSVFACSALLENVITAFDHRCGILSLHDITAIDAEGISLCGWESAHSARIVAVNGIFDTDPEQILNGGETLTVFSSYHAAASIASAVGTSKKIHYPRKTKKTSLLQRFDRMLVIILAGILGVTIASLIYFHIAEKLSFIDSLYFVVTVVTTTGFGDINLKDSTSLSKMVGVLLMLSGVILMTMFYAVLSDSLLKKRVELFFGRRRMKLTGHIVLCGIGDVGVRILEDLLRLGENVVVIERNEFGKNVNSVRERNIPLIISNAANEQALLNANIDHAKALICATDNDLGNLEIALNASALHPGIRVVARMFDLEFAIKVKSRFGLDAALSSTSLASPAFARAVRGGGLMGRYELFGGIIYVREHSASSIDEIVSLRKMKGTKILMLEDALGRVYFHDFENRVMPGSTLLYAEYNHS